MPSEEIQTLIEFVEGRLNPKEFEQKLYANPRFEEVLNDDPTLPAQRRYVYLYAIQLNYDSPDGILNAHGALTKFLQRNGVEVEPTSQYADHYDIILQAQPNWLDLNVDYIQREILPAAGNRTGEALKQWLHQRLLELFKFWDKPPEWIQGCEWPIHDSKPMVFVGQINVVPSASRSKDDLAYYLFEDSNTGEIEVIKQVS